MHHDGTWYTLFIPSHHNHPSETKMMLAVFFVIVALLLLAPVEALAPPHPEWKTFESVHTERRRLNITFNYVPQHISAEHCRYLSEELCQEEDEITGNARRRLQEHAESRRRLQMGATMEFPGSSNADILHSPDKGDFKIPVFLIRFPEDATKPLQPREYFEELFNGKNPSEINPAGSVAQWLFYNSLGQYRVTFDVHDWATAPNSAAYYSKDVSAKGGVLVAQDVFRWRLEELDNQNFDWKEYDADYDQRIDQVVVLHSGFAAEFGDITCGTDWRQRIWSQAATGGVPDGFQSLNSVAFGFTLSSFALASAIGTYELCESRGGDMGIVTHEFMHAFAIPDLYDNDKTNDEYVNIAGTGSFDIMANAYGWNRNGKLPGMLSSYSRQYGGWVDPIRITQDGYYAMQPAEVSGNVFRIDAGYPNGEYLLLENRQGIKWSSDWPQKGLVVLHIDEMAPMQTKRGYPGHPNWPADHYRVAVLQADGNYDIEKGVNLGDEFDIFTTNMTLGPGPDVWPNTDSYQGSQYQTGIKITVVTEPGFVMIIKVEGIQGGENGAPGFVSVYPSDTLLLSRSGTEYMPGDGDLETYEGIFDDISSSSTGSATAWVRSLLGGVAMVLGVLVMLL